MDSAQPAGGAYSLLADGATIEIRAATPADFTAVRQMYRSMSPDNIYLRFFSMSTAAARDRMDTRRHFRMCNPLVHGCMHPANRSKRESNQRCFQKGPAQNHSPLLSFCFQL